jgi:predicted nucleotidyltransferase
MLADSDKLLIQTLRRALMEVAGDRLQTVIAYGSRAWGQAGPDSDLDVAVIIRDLDTELEKAIHEASYQVMWEHDFNPLISVKVFDAANFSTFQEQGFSFYRKVAQEGIPL